MNRPGIDNALEVEAGQCPMLPVNESGFRVSETCRYRCIQAHVPAFHRPLRFDNRLRNALILLMKTGAPDSTALYAQAYDGGQRGSGPRHAHQGTDRCRNPVGAVGRGSECYFLGAKLALVVHS